MKQLTKGKFIKSERVITSLETIGVVMRILAFGMLSILNKDTPFLFMWIWNTLDAVILTYCSWERDNKPYMILNIFWLIVGAIGIYNSI
jgi:phosphoglycerol transferase MdoB-like AlkP superfamily enzyme